MRFCIEYWKQNVVNTKDADLLSRIDNIFDTLTSLTLFSTLYLTIQYQQVKVHLTNWQKTRFSTLFGLF